MASQAFGFAELLGGGILLTMGVSGHSVREVLAGRATSIKPLLPDSSSAAAGPASGSTQLPPGLTGPVGTASNRTTRQRIALLRGLLRPFGITISEGPGFGGTPSSGHAESSLHYEGLAYDISGPPAALRRLFALLQRLFSGEINELFYDPIGYYIDQGRRVQGAIGDHTDHLHIAFRPAAVR